MHLCKDVYAHTCTCVEAEVDFGCLFQSCASLLATGSLTELELTNWDRLVAASPGDLPVLTFPAMDHKGMPLHLALDFVFLKDVFIFMHMNGFAYVCICMHVHALCVPGTLGGQERALDPLEL